MARTHFHDTVIDDAGNALADVTVAVYQRGTVNTVSIYTTASGGTTRPNPFTVTDGIVSFWAEPGSYDLVISDTEIPPRFSTRTVSWDSIPYAGVNDLTLAVDGSVDEGLLATDSVGSAEIKDNNVTMAKIVDAPGVGRVIRGGAAGAPEWGAPVQVGDDVSDLVAFDGAIAKLRVGSTPFDFVVLVYDATYSKWVSEASAVSLGAISNTNTGGVDTEWNGHPRGVMIPHFKAMYDAGLRLQVRGGYRLTEGSAVTSIKARVSEFTNNDTALNTIGTSAALADISTVNQYEVSPAWLDLTVSAPAELHARLAAIFATASNVGITDASIWWRWVSS